MLDTDEANILAVAAASLHGQPVYHPTASPALTYSLMYGPLSFLLYRTLLLLGHGQFWLIRLALVLGNLALCATLYSIARKLLPRYAALALLAYPLCILLQGGRAIFGARADLWIVLCMALAVRAALARSRWTALLATALFAGCAIDFKLTVLPACLSILLLLFRRHGPRLAALAALLAAAIALAPFALPEMSLPTYLSWLVLTSQEGRIPAALLWSLLFALFLAAPLLLAAFSRNKTALLPAHRWLPEAILLTLALLAAALVSAKPGAGLWHFFQLIPLLTLYLAAILQSRLKTPEIPETTPLAGFLPALAALPCCLVALTYTARAANDARPPTPPQAEHLQQARSEINDLLARYPHTTLQMGYGPTPNEPAELLRYLLVLHGNPYTLDGSLRLEIYITPFPSAIAQRMAACTDDLWLIPHAEQPFTHPYFPQTLRSAFAANYRLASPGRIYDLYVCRRPAVPTPVANPSIPR